MNLPWGFGRKRNRNYEQQTIFKTLLEQKRWMLSETKLKFLFQLAEKKTLKESHEDWKLEVITFDLRLVRLNKTSKADTTRYYCPANRTITWLIMATELSGVQFGPKSSEWFQNQVSECAARVRFQITSMISDQNCTPLSSIATFLNEIAKFSYVITNYITLHYITFSG